MKRYTRISPNAICLMPRKAIAWIMLAMAILTMLTLISIEVRRIIWLKNLKSDQQQNTLNSTLGKDLENGDHSSPKTRSILQESSFDSYALPANTEGISLKALMIEDLFKDEPDCHVNIYLLVLVTSAPHHFEQREAIRKTWSNQKVTFGLNTKTVFLVGQSGNKFLNVLVKYEKDISNDILLGDYGDTHRNRTVKLVHGLNWALKRCQPSYVLWTDDDSFVNLPILVSYLYTVFHTTPVLRIPGKRWYDSRVQLQDLVLPAKHISKVGNVLSLNALRKYVEYLEDIRLTFTNDFYIGDMLKLLSDVKHVRSVRYLNYSDL